VKLIGQSKVRRVGGRWGDHAIRKIAQVDIVNKKKSAPPRAMTCCRNPATANLAQRDMGGLYQLGSGSQWKNNKQGPPHPFKRSC